MRRKSTRSVTKSSPGKPPESPRKSRRQSKRQKKSSSRSSSEEPPEKTVIVQPIEDVVEKPPEPAEGEPEEPIWKVTPTSTPSGEIQKLKFCLTRPLLSPDKIEKPGRRGRSSGQTDEEMTTPVLRNSRHRGSSGDNVEERDEESDHHEDKKGKGKSKTKHKSKSENTPQTKDVEDNSHSEISENVQVTPQSPQDPIDNRVDTENLSTNEIETITPAETDQGPTQDSENSSDNYNKTSRNTDDDNSYNTLRLEESNTPPPPILEQESNDSDENFKGFESAPQLKRADYVEHSPEVVTQCEQIEEESIEIDQQEIVMNDMSQVIIIEPVHEIFDQEPEKVSIEFVEVPKECDDVVMEGVVEESCEIESSRLETDPIEDTSPTTIVCLDKSDSSSLDATENVQQEPIIGSPIEHQDTDEHVDEKNISNTEMEVEIHHDDSISTDAVMESSLTPTSTKYDATLEIGQSFSPDIREIVEVNRELQDMKNVASDLLQTPTKPQVIRKWGNAFVGLELMKNSLQKIDIDTIKEFCPKLLFLEENEVKMDIRERKRSHSFDKRERRGDRKVSVDFKTDDFKRLDTQSSINSSEMDEMPEPELDNSNIIAMNRKISIVDDTASKLKPPPSPAKNPISEILFITNLVRPFTLKQLKELLERTGKIKDNGFWTDRIKSKCYAHYETSEEAEITRNALHGVNWPIGNGKKLMIEYATTEDLEKARNPAPPPPPPTPSEPTITNTSIPVQEIATIEVPPKKVEEATKVNKERPRHRSDGPVREWDIGKETLQKGRHHRSRERDVRERGDRNERQKRRRTPSPTDNFIDRKEKKKEEEVPQKLMDDLFRKTKITPSIYWLPLTPDEISTKQQQRLLRMAEHKRRMEESSSRDRGGDYGRGAPFRRRYD